MNRHAYQQLQIQLQNLSGYDIIELVLWRGIEAVITGLTRNQFARKGTWVRIPPSPPPNDADIVTISVSFHYTREMTGMKGILIFGTRYYRGSP